MKSALVFTVFALSISSGAFAAVDCTKSVEKAAIEKCASDCYPTSETKFIKTTSTGKDQYVVTLANGGASFEETYVVYTKSATCNVENVVMVDHE